MNNKWVITVGREYCTGGGHIAKQLADKLGYAYLDKVLIDKTAEMLDASKDFVQTYDECADKYFNVPVYWYFDEDESDVALTDVARVANAQEKVINRFVKDGPCVIVGRRADYILRDYPFLVRVFFHASFDTKVKNVCERYDLPESAAKRLVKKVDKKREKYYNRNTKNCKWGDPKNYDFYIDLDKFTAEEAIDMIINILETRDK